MSTFQFDATKTVDENIGEFLAFMETRDPELGEMLREEIAQLIPLPDDANRTQVRIAFNTKIAKRLDALNDSSGGNP